MSHFELNSPSLPSSESFPSDASPVRNLVMVVRADPIICGHSTEARNLAEAAIEMGMDGVHIVSYPIDDLQKSGLPLKPLETVMPYSEGISVDRPDPVGDYKVLDGRLSYGVSGHLVDLLSSLHGTTALMDLYLVPHGQMVMSAVESFRGSGRSANVMTIGEAVGSDITNVVSNAVAEGKFGAAQIVLSNYLAHDHPVAVSQFTKDLIVEAGQQVDAALGSHFAPRLEQEVGISFPAIDTSAYLEIENQEEESQRILQSRGVEKDGFLLFLSRVAPAKGVDDLIHAYRGSSLYGKKPFLICGNGPAREELMAMTNGDENIRFLDDVSDHEKGFLMQACHAYLLPSKPRPEFIETFGIAVAEKMLAGGAGPVITTRTGGIPEASGGFCLEHAAGDVEDLRAQLDALAGMSLEQRLGLNAAARNFALQFDRRAVLERLLSRGLLQMAA